MTMFIHFFCLCPLSLTIKLNFDISNVAYCASLIFQGMELGVRTDGEIDGLPNFLRYGAPLSRVGGKPFP